MVMQSYSFILTSPAASEQLYRIGQFPDSDHALCLAELIASELSIEANGPWSGWTIEVRDCEGSQVLSIPVGHDDGLHMTDGALAGNRPTQRELSRVA
jgi:hypothetical protein